jgi:hypothetical protein
MRSGQLLNIMVCGHPYLEEKENTTCCRRRRRRHMRGRRGIVTHIHSSADKPTTTCSYH